MPDDHVARLAEVVKSALDRPPEARAAFIASACADHPDLQAKAVALLGQGEGLGDFLEEPAVHLMADSLLRGPGLAGITIGQYEIESLIASGGMGEVYLARDRQLQRQVALKVIRRGWESAAIARHFKREELLLASLNHPNIAQLYGGGVTAEGVPYFAMEYVPGQRLDEYCAERELPLPERIELFRKVCAAVAYAHQHLVIHRDLKPANIRVTAEGEPKLLDFGIARLLEAEGSPAHDQTVTLTTALTPDYASPEQVSGESMTTASDIYSLGVILYELLAGQKPYRLSGRQPAEMARAIAAQEPPRPSALRPGLHRDLDHIVLMALRKEPTRRYASAGQLSDDLRRHRAGLPVTARPDTLGYRAGKFARRHKAAVAAAALVALALIAGLVATTWQARVARQERDRAQIANKQAERLNNFLENLLGSADPTRMGKDVKVSQVLDAAAQKLDRELAAEPEILAQAHATLSRVYQNLGLYDKAEQESQANLAVVRRLHGPEDPAAARAEADLGGILAARYQGKEAEPLLRHALVVERSQPVKDEAALADTYEALTFIYSSGKHPNEAAPLSEEALQHARAAWGDADQRFLGVLAETGNIKIARHDFAGAEVVFRHLLALNDKLTPGGLASIAPQINLCICLFNQDKLADLEPVLARLERDSRRLVGEHSAATALAQAIRGCLEFALKDYAKATSQLRGALAFLSGTFPPGQLTIVQCQALLGLSLTRTGHAAEGEPLLQLALQTGRGLDRVEFAHTVGNLETALGECLLAQKKYAAAEPLFRVGYDDLLKRLGPQNRFTVEAADRLRLLKSAEKEPGNKLTTGR